MGDNTELQKLLDKLSSIDFKYKKLSEANLTKFNVFSILRKEHDEVFLHSRFIGELLDPNGSHGQKSTFLKLFVQCLVDGGYVPSLNLEEDWISVERERDNIDILITGRKKVLVIENKIYAHDQDKQLQRYFDTVKGYNFSADQIELLYLTLDGHEPAEGAIGKKVHCVSYGLVILDWLRECVKEVVEYPTLRESIIQYLNLVKKLTGQSTDLGEINEMKELLRDQANFELIEKAHVAANELKIETHMEFWKRLRKALNSNEGHSFQEFKLAYAKKHTEGVFKDYVYGSRNHTQIALFENLETGIQFDGCNELYGIGVQIEVFESVFWGFVLTKDEVPIADKEVISRVKNERSLSLQSFKENLKSQEKLEEPEGYLESRYFFAIQETNLNFRRFQSDAVLGLLDENKLQDTVDALAQRIMDFHQAFNESGLG